VFKASNEAQERSSLGVQFKFPFCVPDPGRRPNLLTWETLQLSSFSVADPDLELRGNPRVFRLLADFSPVGCSFLTKTKGRHRGPRSPPLDSPLALYMNGANSIHLTDAYFGMTFSMDA